MSSIQGFDIQITYNQLMQRFKRIQTYSDVFAREYIISMDTLTNRRAIHKNYLAQNSDQQSAIYGNLENYVKLSEQEGISKFITYARLQDQKQLQAVFEYDQLSLAEFIQTQKFISNRKTFYIQLLQQITSIIRSMTEIGIDLDQLNYGNILIRFQENSDQQFKIVVFYDERQKTCDKILQGFKTFTSIQKLTAMASNDQTYFNDLMQLPDSISPQNIYQLGLISIDLMYQGQTTAQLNNSVTDDFMSRDRPVSRSKFLNNYQKSYYLVEDGVITLNSQYLEEKLTYLLNNNSHLIKEMALLAQSMITKYQQRISINELPGQIDRIMKIFRDSTRKVIRSVSNQSIKKANSNQKIKNSKQQILANQNDQQSQFSNSIHKNVHSRSVNSSNNSQNNKNSRLQSQTNIMENGMLMSNQNNTFQNQHKNIKYTKKSIEISENQNFHTEQISTSKITKQVKIITNYESNEDIRNTFGVGGSLGIQETPQNNFNRNQLNNHFANSSQQKQIKNQYSEHGFSSHENMRQSGSKAKTLQNTKQTMTTKVKYTDTNENIKGYNQAVIQNQKPTKLIIPKQQILMNLKTHQSIKSTLQNLIREIQKMQTLKKKQYFDNSVYYGEISSQTNKRSGLGLYIYPTGDIYYGTWNQNVLINGTYIFKNGQSYEGNVRNGKQGWGKYRYCNGNVYQGQWKDDIKEGKGTMWYPNQDKYQGQWHKGKKNGWGKYYYNNATIYEGNFLNGRKNGFGTIFFTNGTRIEANWHQTHVEGQGKVFYSNGDYFQGDYSMSQKHGRGLYVWSGENTKYEGQFKKDSLEGQARIHFTDKQQYFGRIRNGKRDGQGSYTYQNGDSFAGEWKNDLKLIGNYKFKNGDNFQGKFKDNQLNFGVLRYNNGQVYEGEFRNGYRHGVGSYRNKEGQVVCEGHWQTDNFIQNHS